MRRRFWLTAGTAAVLAALPASPASAHGLVGRADPPIPDWLFSWGPAAVLVASFVGLAVAWPTPRLQNHPFRALPDGLSLRITWQSGVIVAATSASISGPSAPSGLPSLHGR